MRSLKLAFSIVHLIICIAIVAVVITQTGKSAGLGAISGSSGTFLARNKQKSLDARLAKATKWIAVAFIVITLILNMI